MSSKYTKNQEPIPYKALLDENHALKDEMQSLRARLEEAEELKRAISEGDLDALVLPGSEGELIFTLDSADQAYRILVETMNEGTATLAFDGTVLYCNRRLAELLNMPIHTIIGTSIYRFIAPESAITFKGLLNNKIGTGEVKFRARDGTSLPVYLSISSLQSERSPNSWCLVITDLTEQKKNEEVVADERLARSIIEQAAEAIVVCDTSGRIIRFSNAMPGLCGCDPTFQRFEDLINLRFSEEADIGKSILPVSSALEGSAILGLEAIFEPEDCQRFHLLLNSGPLKNYNGEIIGCVVTLTDITERKQAEQALRESEARLQVIIAHSPDIIFEQDRDLRYTWIFNPASPYAVSDVLGKTDAELLPPDQAKQLESIKRRVLDKGMREQAILRLAPGGEPRCYEAIYEPRYNEAGQVIGVLSYTRDITERKQMEIALKRNEQRLNGILSSIQDGFFELDQEWRLTYINKRAARNGGFEPEELIGECIWEKFPYMVNSKLEEVYRQVMETRLPANFEIKSLVRDQWYGISIYPSASGISAFWRDITDSKRAEEVLRQAYEEIQVQSEELQAQAEELKEAYETLNESEKRYRLIFDNSMDAIILTDPRGAGEVLSVNPAACQMLGCSEKELIGKMRDALFDPEDPAISAFLDERAHSGSARTQVTYRRKDGTTLNGELSSTLFIDSNGEPRSVAIIRDVTKRKRAEEELSHQRETLQRIFDNIPVLLVMWDPHLGRFTLNHHGEQVLGWTTADANDGDFMAKVYPDAASRSEMSAYMLSLTTGWRECICTTKNGQHIPIDWANIFLTDDTMIGIGVDLRERKAAEEALRKSEELFRTVIENSRDGINMLDLATGRYVFMSPAQVELTGFTAEEINNISAEEAYERVHPEDREKSITQQKWVATGLDMPGTVEYRWKVKSGEYRWFSDSRKLVRDAKGQPVALVGVSRDISERKRAEEALRESEERMRYIAQIGRIGFVEWNAAKDTGYWTREHHEIFGYEPGSQMPWEQWTQGVHPDDRERVLANASQLLDRGRSEGQVWGHKDEYRFIRPDGNVVWIESDMSVDMIGGDPIICGSVRDITERKRTEEALRESEAKFRQIVETSQEGIWLINGNDQTVFVNQKISEMLGYSVEELMGQTPRKFMAPEFSAKADDNLHEHMQGAKHVIDCKFIRKDGSDLWCILSSNILFEDQGKYAGSLAMITDITERKQAEKALQESEETARQRLEEIEYLYRNAPVGLCMLDRELRYVRINERLAEMNGVSAATHIGKQIRELLPQLADTVEPEMLRVLETGEPQLNIEIISETLSQPGVKRNWLEQWLPITDSQGNTIGLNIVVEETTERKWAEEALRKSEELFRKIFENAAIGIAISDRDGRIINSNPAVEHMLGYSRDELRGKTFSEFTHPDDVLKEKLLIEELLSGYSDHYDIEKRYIRKDGQVILIQLKGGFIGDKNGKPIAGIALIEDITERKRAEEALKKAHDTLEEKVKERTAELEEAYNSLLENELRLSEAQKLAHLGNWELDVVTGKLHWSDELYRIFGRSPEKSGVNYNEFLSYVHPDDRDYVDNTFKKGLNREHRGIDYRIVLANGEERTIHTQAEIISDDENIPVQLKGITQEITERKKAEEKIQNLANIVESSNDAIITKSFEDIITSWNKGAEQIYGYSAKEALGRPISILEPDSLKGEIKQLDKMIKQGEKIHNYETSRLKKDGTLINVSVTLSPTFNSSGELVAISTIARDITERRKAEEAVKLSNIYNRSLIEASPDPLVTIGPDGKITDVNNSTETATGRSRYELIGTDFSDYFTEPEKAKEGYQLVFQEGFVRDYPLEIQHKNGRIIPVLYNASIYKNEAGEVIGIFAAARDITERIKAEEALVKIEKIRIKEIHHRIKNNLQVICSLLDLQAETFEDETVKMAFREGQDRVISMSLIHEELYKGEGTDKLDFSAYLKKLAKSLFQTYSLSSKNIRLCTGLEENAFLDMDTAVPLGIIVNELVSNSLKHAFTEKQEGEIRIQLCKEEQNNEMNNKISESFFSLTVSDNGKGIPEDLELESVESLGLQLVGILVDQLDGEVDIKRIQGTEFKITFRVAERCVVPD